MIQPCSTTQLFPSSSSIRSERHQRDHHGDGDRELHERHQHRRPDARRRPLPGQPAGLLPLYFPLQAPADSVTTHFYVKMKLRGSLETRGLIGFQV